MIFVAQILPQEDELLQNSMASQLYQNKFIEFCYPDYTISIIPAYIYKKYNQTGNDICYLNFGKTKNLLIFNLTKLVGDTFHALKVIAKKKENKIWFYNLNRSTFLIAFFAKYLLKNKIYLIIADYSKPYSFLTKIVDKMIKKFDGGIVLNSNINVLENYIVMPGLLRESDIVSPDPNNHFIYKILLSGSLGYTTGLDFALSFFSEYKEYQLYITGVAYGFFNGEFDSLITQYKDYENIHYLGRLNYSQYIEIIDECDICLSLRDPDDEQHDYNFPSKILEYLSHNKFVISTKSYHDIHPDLLFVSEKTKQALKETIDKIYRLSDSEILNKKKFIYDQLKGSFSSSALNNNIFKVYQ
jgi:hypothetical protein